jgi:putative transposase
MPRFARVVVPGIPHHITYRGNRRDDVFFSANNKSDDV